jgi:SAM-dependent methyltransferase
MDVAKTARAANVEHYDGGEEIEQYLREPYHALRLSLAVSLLSEELHRLSPRVSCPLVADIGSASGVACRLLAARGMRPLAADADLAALRAVREANITGVQLDATEPLPFRNRSLDGILAGELIEHVYYPMEFLNECRRVLRPSGVLVLTTPNLAALQDRLTFLRGRSPRHVNCHHEYLKLHIRPFTKVSLEEAVRRAGFEPTKVMSNYVVWRTSSRKFSSRLLARALPGLGGTLVLGAQVRDLGTGRTGSQA